MGGSLESRRVDGCGHADHLQILRVVSFLHRGHAEKKSSRQLSCWEVASNAMCREYFVISRFHSRSLSFFAIQEDGRCIKVGEEATPMLLCEQFRIDHAISTFLFSWTISCPTQANIWMIDSAVTNVVTCGCCFGGANSKVFNISLSRIFEPPIWGYPVQAHVRAQIAEKCTEDSFCSKNHMT